MKTKRILLAIVLNLFGWNISAQEMVKDIAPGYNTSYPLGFCINNGIVFFAADDKVNGTELWKTDGTTAGTVMVKNINPAGSGIFTGGTRKIVTMGGNVYFSADDGSNGKELWKSDGTAAGTVLVKDIQPGARAGVNATRNGHIAVIATEGTVRGGAYARVGQIHTRSCPVRQVGSSSDEGGVHDLFFFN